MKFWTIVFSYKLRVTEKRTYVNKFKFPFFPTVFLSIPLNKLPCVKATARAKAAAGLKEFIFKT